MTVTERLMGVGKWELTLRPDVSRTLLDRLDPRTSGFGHVVITSVPVDVGLGEPILGISRYSGVYRKLDGLTLSGVGPALWIADEDGVGPFYATDLTTASGTFAQWVAKLRPAQLGTGITSVIGGTYAKSFFGVNLREPLDDICTFFGTEWRVTPALKFDIGKRADLFRAVPVAVVVAREGEGGRDYNVTGVVGDVALSRDVENIVRRVNLYTGDRDAPTVNFSVSGIADADYPWRGPDGTVLRRDKRFESWDAPVGSEVQYATNLLNFNKFAHQEITLTARTYDIGRDVRVGDNLWVYDPANGIADSTNQITYRGQQISPEVIRCVGYTWPVRRGMGVYFRRFVKSGGTWVPEWTDLTNHIEWQAGTVSVEIGAKPRPSTG